MTCLLSIVLATSLIGQDGPRNAVEFAALMKTLHGEIKSVSFVFEGETVGIPPDLIPRPGRQPTVFEGLYALRPGPKQAGLLETYERKLPDPPRHQSKAMVNGTVEDSAVPLLNELRFDPATGKPIPFPTYPGVLRVSSSAPEWVFFSWYFSVYVDRDFPEMDFENLGWEDVDGHRCLKVKLGRLPGLKRSGMDEIFWLDLERGGHPLRVDSYDNENLLSRAERIELAEVTDENGKKLWFPVKGEMNVYGAIGEKPDDFRSAHTSYRVNRESIRLNRNLPDSVFVIHTKPRTELPGTLRIKQEYPADLKPLK